MFTTTSLSNTKDWFTLKVILKSDCAMVRFVKLLFEKIALDRVEEGHVMTASAWHLRKVFRKKASVLIALKILETKDRVACVH